MTVIIPRYSRYKLSSMVLCELDKNNLTTKEASERFNIEEDLLKDILESNVRFKLKHYKVISSITGYSIDELLEEEVVSPVRLENNLYEKNRSIEERVNIISDFFKEVALLKRT